MTDLMTEPTSTPHNTTWDAQFALLKARFPKAKDSIVFCIHAMQTNPGITIDDLKAQAAMHGIRVTAASASAANKLMAEQSGTRVATTVTPLAVPTSPRQRRVPANSGPLDVEGLIRATVGKLQEQGNSEAERLRGAVRRAIEVLQSAVE